MRDLYTILKILTSLFMLLLPLAILIRDWKYRDQRTKRHHQFTRNVVLLWLLTAVLAAGLIWYESYESSQLSRNLESLRRSNDSLYTQNSQLLTQSEELLSLIAQYQDDIEEQKHTINSLRDYSHVATLDALGYPPGLGLGSDLKFNSPLTEMLEGTYTTKDKQLFMKRDSQAEARYRAVIDKYPNSPFAYYFVALCLHQKDDSGWRQYAEAAVNILMKTTMIDGHNANHDEVLQKLQSMLKQN